MNRQEFDRLCARLNPECPADVGIAFAIFAVATVITAGLLAVMYFSG